MIKNNHYAWIRERSFQNKISAEKLKATVAQSMIFLDSDYCVKFPDLFLLDSRYLYITSENKLKSINPLVSECLHDIYQTTSEIEKFLNQKDLDCSAAMFEWLLITA